MKSYEYNEMHPMKFNRYHKGIRPTGVNFPNKDYNKFGCNCCLNHDDCPIEVKLYHSTETLYDNYVNGKKSYSVAAWCMGSNGYNKFKADWDYVLNEDQILKEIEEEYMKIHKLDENDSSE